MDERRRQKCKIFPAIRKKSSVIGKVIAGTGMYDKKIEEYQETHG